MLDNKKDKMEKLFSLNKKGQKSIIIQNKKIKIEKE